ncbi:MAG TPA: isopentenyl-diphosphate Delta-isomerase [Fluviicola sp.]|nr:isopentenyl-diphosphate Delta-isomerase [Fluviicola sp.]
MQEVILVDSNDRPVGTMEKMEAHQKGLLHRAFSVFIFNDNNELLLQQRALEKYHSGGLWTNTCCSHPAPDESLEAAGARRLQEEMGFSAALSRRFAFEYRVDLDNQLIEHEYDHVLTGTYNGEILPDPQEVMAFRWISMNDLLAEVKQHPDRFTSWFKIIMDDHIQHFS